MRLPSPTVSFRVLGCMLLLGWAGPRVFADEPTTTNYDVTDLVTPADDALIGREALADALLDAVRRCAALADSSAARVTYVAKTGQITVTHSPAGQRSVAELLDVLRERQKLGVASVMTLVRVDDACFQRTAATLGLDRRTALTVESARLDEWLDDIRNSAHSAVMTAPRLISRSGQKAEVRVQSSDDRMGFDVACLPGQSQVRPIPRSIGLGVTMQMRATVLPDNQTTFMTLDLECAELAEAAPSLFALALPRVEGTPRPMTQLLREPQIVRRGVTQAIGVPAGQTAVVYAGRASRAATEVDAQGEPRETTRHDHLVLFVCPKLINVPLIDTTRARPTQRMPEQVVRRVAYEEPAEACVKLRADMIEVDADYFDRADAEAWADFAPAQMNPVKNIDAEVAGRFVRAVRAQGAGRLVAQPTLVTRDGATASFLSGGQQTFVVGIDFVERAGATEAQLKQKSIDLGTTLDLTPQITPDGQACRMAMMLKQSRLNDTPAPGCKVFIDGMETEVTACPPVSVSQSHLEVGAIPWGRSIVLARPVAGGAPGKLLYVIVTPERDR